MSLILEALKKSEQQRRLGETPTLGSPVVATRKPRGALPVLVVLIVIAGAIAWWLMRSPAPAPASSPPPATVANTPPPNAKPLAPAKTTAPAQPRNADTFAARKAAELARRDAAAQAQNAKNATTPTAPVGTTAANNAPAPPVKSAGVAPPPPVVPPTKTADAGMKAAPAPTKDAISASATPADAALPKNAAAPTDKTTAGAPSKTSNAQPSSAQPATGASLPTIWDLPYSTRKDIPAIDLSMHVYSSDPKQRFVVIKGDRHVEGDEIGQDLVLKEIRQDGLVIEFKGQKFFFPRNGR
jgi:general secretion pathway protein B